MNNTFNGSLFGDPQIDELAAQSVGDFDYTELSQGDVEAADKVGSGAAVVSAVNARKGRALTTGKKEIISAGSKALETSVIPCLWGTNLTVTQPGALGKISGHLLIQNLAKHRTATPLQTIIKTAAGAGIADTTVVSFGVADLPAGAGMFTCPIIFISIAASAQFAAAGAGLSVSIETVNEYAIQNTRDAWAFERKNINEPIRLTSVPYVRLKDDLIPVLASWGANGATLNVKIKGLSENESVRVTIPGVDSQELKSFLKTWNIS